MIFNTAIPAGGGGSSQWTDISSAYATGLTDVNDDGAFAELDIVAYTNGQLVYLSGEIERGSNTPIVLPSGYEATRYAAGGAFDYNYGSIATCIINNITDYNCFDVYNVNMDSCLYFSFTLIYPIA